jgi:hypothetical protein
VFACGGAPTDDAVDDVNAGPSPDDEIGEIGTVRQAFVTDDYIWGGTQSASKIPPKRMMHDTTGFCYLTKISGVFRFVI